MKKTFLLVLIFVLLTIASNCSAPSTSTPIPPTSIPSQTPAPTNTIAPTDTLEPSPTPIAYPDVLNRIFSNIHVLYEDDFKFDIQGRIPDGWVSANDGVALRETGDNYFRIDPRPDSQGDLFYYKEEVINPGEGVFLSFQYTGTENTFTWGLDNIDAQGQFFKFKTDGYYSFAMQMLGQHLSAHVIEGPYLKDDDFKGNLILREGTWYNFTVAFDKDDNYIIQIWELDSPENQLVYTRNWPNSPNAYYFISWIGGERILWMDDFMIFSFDNLIQP